MRLPIAVLLLLALPAPASAGVVGLEGTQLVFRADPGERARLADMHRAGGKLVVTGEHRTGPGCTLTHQIECPAAGVTGVTVHTGARDDRVSLFVGVPVTLSLGAGDDRFFAQAAAVAVDAGPGNDRDYSQARTATLVGGEGDDRLELETYDAMAAPVVLDGGAGDDTLAVLPKGLYTTFPSSELGGAPRPRATPVAITCGPGADRWTAGPRDVIGAGCVPHVAGITPDTVSRSFREGRLTARATGSVTLWRRAFQSEHRRERVARATFSARRGPLRVKLGKVKPQPVAVSVRTRSGAERGEIRFLSRLR